MFESDSRKACADRSLVLSSLDIPYEMLQDGARSLLLVPAEFAEKAKYELWQYDVENARPAVQPARVATVHQDATWGIVGYIVVISLVAVLAGVGAFDRDWFAQGEVNGVLIRNGEWWRNITALTLHSGLSHFLGNAGFGALFGFMAGRVLGPGVTWLAIVVSASIANFIDTMLLDTSHRAIGASTAVFAALGLVAGFVWRAKLSAEDRWAYRLGPIVGGIALLAYTGTGGEHTDVGAHLAGFVCGFVTGTVLTRFYRVISDRNIQKYAAITAVAIVLFAWMAAL